MKVNLRLELSSLALRDSILELKCVLVNAETMVLQIAENVEVINC